MEHLTNPDPRLLDLDDLIDALAGKLRWANAHEDLSDYWTRRFDLLCEALSLDPTVIDPTSLDEVDPGSSSARWLLHTAATSLLDPPNPFRGVLESTALLASLYSEVAPALKELARMHESVNRQVARKCLLSLAPELEHRTCSPEVLVDGGLDLSPPDPELYW